MVLKYESEFTQKIWSKADTATAKLNHFTNNLLYYHSRLSEIQYVSVLIKDNNLLGTGQSILKIIGDRSLKFGY